MMSMLSFMMMMAETKMMMLVVLSWRADQHWNLQY
jgi:hypothetical protein